MAGTLRQIRRRIRSIQERGCLILRTEVRSFGQGDPRPRFFAALRMTSPAPTVILRTEATKPALSEAEGNLAGWPRVALSQERLGDVV